MLQVRHATLTQHGTQLSDPEDLDLCSSDSGVVLDATNTLTGLTSVELVTTRMGTALLDAKTLVGAFHTRQSTTADPRVLCFRTGCYSEEHELPEPRHRDVL